MNVSKTNLEALTLIFRDFFEDPNLELSSGLTASDISAWDSLAHVSLMLKVENHFGLRFRMADVAELSNVGELLELIEKESR